MCKVFKVSRSGYYAWSGREQSKLSMCREVLCKRVEDIYHKSKGRYGSPKITAELRQMGLHVSRPRVARIMKDKGLRSIITGKFRVCTTDSNHNLEVSPNILNREFTATAPSEKWVSDLTYIRTKCGWLYLTAIMDLFDRRIVGWSMSTGMTARETVVTAWNMAIKNRSVAPAMIFHSDRGVQYASGEFRDLLKGNSVQQSMSRKGNCWDNAVMENFFKILKSETGHHTVYDSTDVAKRELFEFIEIWYNRQRRHSILGYLSPEEFSKSILKKAA
ncbi:Transposase InsO and inactivated derivatives [Chitinophaga arvensicola]|uniref:Transposase InsO and inactivated derivatives n=2 Tax=Chitinophaga arvensicola TaxID=29529 RepID=A0A1I0SDX8_9BACT|nr:Transposase InsO and inactivated derivatives [Chitinophaga arvensicola]